MLLFRPSLLALLAFLGCDRSAASGAAETDATGPAELTIGTGIEAFTAFEDGDTLDLVTGCQGLQHIWIALRLAGLDPRGPILDLSLTRDRDDEVVSQLFRVRVSLREVEGETYAEVAGLTLVVPEPDLALEEDLILRASVTERPESGMRTISSERPIRIAWAPGGCR